MSEVDFSKMLPLYGRWTTPSRTTAEFSSASDAGHGLTLLSTPLEDGVLECEVQLPVANAASGAFIAFRASGQKTYYAAGLGGWDAAYTLAEGRHLALTRLASAGNISNLTPGRTYRVRIALEGQRVGLSIDGISVLDYDRLVDNTGTGLGLFAFSGTTTVIFGPMHIDDRRPNAFIAMPFSEPYNEVYRDAIRPIVDEIGYDPFRVDEAAGPGIILNDIWNRITEASVVLAEISEPNPNVYYEIGVAHALKKPTVLLAQRGTKLPFDVGPHRCIFYDNTIAGRQRLVDALRGSLISLLGLAGRADVANGLVRAS